MTKENKKTEGHKTKNINQSTYMICKLEDVDALHLCLMGNFFN